MLKSLLKLADGQRFSKVGKNKKGLDVLPQDPDGYEMFKVLVQENKYRVFPKVSHYDRNGAAREAMILFGLGRPARKPSPDDWAEHPEFRLMADIIAAAESHPEVDRMRRAMWLDMTVAQTWGWEWNSRNLPHLNSKDIIFGGVDVDVADFVRVCQVAAARMLSQKKLLGIRLDEKTGQAVIVHVEWPDDYGVSAPA